MKIVDYFPFFHCHVSISAPIYMPKTAKKANFSPREKFTFFKNIHYSVFLSFIKTFSLLFKTNFLLFTPPSSSEGKKALTEIVEQHKQAHSHQHGDIALQLLAQERSGQDQFHALLGNAVGQSHADGNVDHKSNDHSLALFLIFKGKVFIQEKADHAAHGIVANGGQPIADLPPLVQSGDIIQTKHHRGTHKGVDDSDDQKADKTAVKNLLLHPRPFRRTPGTECTGVGL